MNWVSVILLATAVSFDSLAIGSTYGLAKIKIPLIPRLLLSIISAIFLLTAMVIGDWLTQWFAPDIADLVGGILLIMLGAYTWWRSSQTNDPPQRSIKPTFNYSLVMNIRIPFLGLIIHVIKQPLAADYDKSKIISMQEAVFLGLALALDAFAAGIGAAILNFPPIATALAVMIVNLVFVSLGLRSGKWLKEKANGVPINWVPATIIILIGLLKIASL